MFITPTSFHESRSNTTLQKESHHESKLKDGIKGKVQEVKGKVKAIAGRATRNPDLEAEGQAQEAVGRIRQRWNRKKVFGR